MFISWQRWSSVQWRVSGSPFGVQAFSLIWLFGGLFVTFAYKPNFAQTLHQGINDANKLLQKLEQKPEISQWNTTVAEVIFSCVSHDSPKILSTKSESQLEFGIALHPPSKVFSGSALPFFLTADKSSYFWQAWPDLLLRICWRFLSSALSRPACRLEWSGCEIWWNLDA